VWLFTALAANQKAITFHVVDKRTSKDTQAPAADAAHRYSASSIGAGTADNASARTPPASA